MNTWQSAYATMADVSATPSGLLFIVLPMASNGACTSRRDTLLFVSKRNCFDFLSVMVFALIYQLPAIASRTTGCTLIAQIATRIAWHVDQWMRFSGRAPVHGLMRETAVPVRITLALTLACVAAFEARAQTLMLTCVAMLLMLFGARKNAWLLLSDQS